MHMRVSEWVCVCVSVSELVRACVCMGQAEIVNQVNMAEKMSISVGNLLR